VKRNDITLRYNAVLEPALTIMSAPGATPMPWRVV
jgi:hypothetical protein